MIKSSNNTYTVFKYKQPHYGHCCLYYAYIVFVLNNKTGQPTIITINSKHMNKNHTKYK